MSLCTKIGTCTPQQWRAVLNTCVPGARRISLYPDIISLIHLPLCLPLFLFPVLGCQSIILVAHTGLFASFLKQKGHQDMFFLGKGTLWGNCKKCAGAFQGHQGNDHRAWRPSPLLPPAKYMYQPVHIHTLYVLSFLRALSPAHFHTSISLKLS